MADNRFKQLFSAYYPEILQHLTRLTGERSAAEDLAQEVFLKLYFQAPGELINPRAWLYRVATNSAYNYLRKEKNRNRQEVTFMLDSAPSKGPDDPALRSIERLSVREVLDTLSWRDRTCLLMKFSGHSYSEIAEAIHVDRSSVGTILIRAQEKFRREYVRKLS
jgi:RNA polymerase sigma factor (sigma-70 family)